ncbi:MAG: hypothetical protein WB988_06460, partial [Candidatus Nitrosopolaris sp.]
EDEKRELYDLLDNNPDIKYRTKIVLLAGDGYTVPEIREMTDISELTNCISLFSTHSWSSLAFFKKSKASSFSTPL